MTNYSNSQLSESIPSKQLETIIVEEKELLLKEIEVLHIVKVVITHQLEMVDS